MNQLKMMDEQRQYQRDDLKVPPGDGGNEEIKSIGRNDIFMYQLDCVSGLSFCIDLSIYFYLSIYLSICIYLYVSTYLSISFFLSISRLPVHFHPRRHFHLLGSKAYCSPCRAVHPSSPPCTHTYTLYIYTFSPNVTLKDDYKHGLT